MRVSEISKETDTDGDTYYGIIVSREVQITSLEAVFSLSRSFQEIAHQNDLYYDYWTIGTK